MDNFKQSVFTTKHVIKDKKEVIYVVHDSTGEWQFLSNDNMTVNDLMIVSLDSLIDKDSSLKEILTLKPGYQAIREKLGQAWKMSEIQE